MQYIIDYGDQGGRALRSRGGIETCFGSIWKQYEQEEGNYAHLSSLSCDFGLNNLCSNCRGILHKQLCFQNTMSLFEEEN